MNIGIEEHKSWVAKYSEVIKIHVDTKDYAHPYSFLVLIGSEIIAFNDYREDNFKKRFRSCLRLDIYPFSIFHKKKHLAPLEHVQFVSDFMEIMSNRGRRSAPQHSHSDLIIAFEQQ